MILTDCCQATAFPFEQYLREFQNGHHFLIEDAIRTWLADRDIPWNLWPIYARRMNLIHHSEPYPINNAKGEGVGMATAAIVSRVVFPDNTARDIETRWKIADKPEVGRMKKGRSK